MQNHVELTAAGVVFGDPLLVGFVRRWGGDETVMRAMQAMLQAFCASVEGYALRLACGWPITTWLLHISPRPRL